MKSFNDYMEISYKMEVIEDKEEGGYVVSYPDLPGCITCGETIEQAIENAIDAKRAWIKAALNDGISIQIPEKAEEDDNEFTIMIPRSLKRSLLEHSQKEGVSVNQYCLYLLSKNDALLRE